MNTPFEGLHRTGEPVGRDSARRGHGWRIAGACSAAAFLLVLTCATAASATPTTTFWTVTTASCQAAGVPHVTYDTYFRKGPVAGTQGAPNYPIDTGLTVGLIPSNTVQAEAGFDLLLPSEDPLFLNAKLCTPESSLFKNSPAIGGGIYNVGTKSDVTDFNVLYLVVQKSLPVGGYVAGGVYHALNEFLLTNSEGEVVKTGALFGAVSPDIQIGLTGLKKINFAADVQTGKNVLGAWGFGANIYVADNVSILTGPVYFFDKALQPGGKGWLWTVQLDVDVPLGR
ncbi:MAG TPA: hypothetical protein VKB34_18400 [Povalibacter sp.]|nr:hypothetical protein [Povalibacter sp.]